MTLRLTIRAQSESLLIDGAAVFTSTTERLQSELLRLHSLNRPSLIITPNVDQILLLSDDEHFRKVFHNADLRLIDGMPLVYFARLLGLRDASRHTGADLLPFIARAAVERRWRIAIIGGREEVRARAVKNLNTAVGSEIVLGIASPPPGAWNAPASQEIIQELHRHSPDFVFVCLGAPKQELWYSEWREELPAAVYVGAGAAVDFAAGAVRRAPRWIQSAGLEWLWRLSCEPRRLARRYLIRGPRILTVFLRSLRKATV